MYLNFYPLILKYPKPCINHVQNGVLQLLQLKIEYIKIQ